MRKTYLLLVLLLTTTLTAQTMNDVYTEFERGNYAKAGELISTLRAEGELSPVEKWDLIMIEALIKRIKLDFRLKLKDILPYIKKYYPDVNDEMVAEWEADKYLEYKIIDGEKFYFRNAAYNLFRNSKEARQRKREVDGPKKDALDEFREEKVTEWINASEEHNKRFVKPVRMVVTYKLSVDADAVPEGEILRCWMPYPKEIEKRQTDVKLISAGQDEYVIADNDHPHRSIYMEQPAVAGKPAVFTYKFEFTGCTEYVGLDFNSDIKSDKDSELYKEFTSERPPHIVFSDKIRKLSEEIVGNETSPLKKMKLIYDWIDENIPWASAREYSTIPDIPLYCVENMHGDCGIQSLLFITLCRLNGIPAKWQSGWMLHPPEVNLHDWAQVHLGEYGWVPVDMSFGKVNSTDNDEKYFYLNGIDPYHMVVNEDYSRPFFPMKIYPRSETVDFQRGEVEWRGGNLYFNQWSYDLEVEYFEK